MALAGYEYFLRTARSLQWDAGEIDLSEDAAAWPSLRSEDRDRVMGLIAGYFAFKGDASQNWRLFLTTGILGGYTTFSAFSLDAVAL